MRYVLAIDLGTGGPKVALVSTAGQVVAHTFRANELLFVPPDGVEQDPEQWWSTISDGAVELIGAGHVPVEEIVAVSVTSQWMSLVPVDADGVALTNAISWMDSRGAAGVTELVRGPVNVQGYDVTKLRSWLRYAGGIPSKAGKDPVGHACWLAAEHPDLYARTHKLLDAPDYLNLRLTGRAVTSADVAVGFWATDNRDLATVDWVDQLVAFNGLDRAKLPDVVPTGSIIGTVLPEVADAWGLGHDVKVITATGDTCSAGIGAGTVRDFDAHVYIGTSSWLSCHVPFKKTDILNNITSLPSGIPGRYWVATEQDTAGKCLSWLIDNILYPDDGLGDRAPDDVYERLFAVAADVPAGANGVIFTPWLNGERTPVDDHRIRAGFHHLGLSTERRDLVRAVLEGVALNTRWMRDSAEKFAKSRFEHLTFIGGGARTDVWCQIMADVLDRPIRQTADPVLVNVRGAGLAGAVALGHLRWDEIPDLIEITKTFQPNPAHRRVYDDHYRAFLRLYKKNKSVHAKLTDAAGH